MHLIRLLLVPVVIALIAGFLLAGVGGLLVLITAANVLQENLAVNLLTLSAVSLGGAGTAIGLLAVAQALESRNAATAGVVAAPVAPAGQPYAAAPQHW